jgi:hypothetical protein
MVNDIMKVNTMSKTCLRSYEVTTLTSPIPLRSRYPTLNRKSRFREFVATLILLEPRANKDIQDSDLLLKLNHLNVPPLVMLTN